MADRAGGAGAEQPHEVLQRAANALEERAGKASPGPWFYEGGAIHHPGADGYTVAPYAEWEDTTGNAHWICTMSPSVAAPLVAWLRTEAKYANVLRGLGDRAAEDIHVEHALTFARMVLGEAT